ncbi:MAG: flagellar hook-basal body complex protein FliE [Hyphomicrobium aestuarii]|nr:flagellar hook-basal body complex protein FliE [Hyphomicrobium aestuarii]
MNIDPVKGYSAQQKLAVDSPGGLSRAGASGGVSSPVENTDFADLIGEAVAGLAQQLHKAESVSVAGIKGTASTQAVVEQVMAAEQSLQISIALRDKIVAAYLEISRMQI